MKRKAEFFDFKPKLQLCISSRLAKYMIHWDFKYNPFTATIFHNSYYFHLVSWTLVLAASWIFDIYHVVIPKPPVRVSKEKKTGIGVT